MSVYLYPGGFRLIRKSGVGQAILHQRKALAAAGIPLAQAMAEGDIVHINTVFPDSLLAALAARLFGKKVVYYGLIWIILAGILLFMPKYRKIGVAVLAGLVLEVICCNRVLKPLVARIRPCDVNTAVQLLVARPDDFSFPSGHTGASLLLAVGWSFRGSVPSVGQMAGIRLAA